MGNLCSTGEEGNDQERGAQIDGFLNIDVEDLENKGGVQDKINFFKDLEKKNKDGGIKQQY